MKLYYTPKTISVAVVIALFEADIQFEAIKIDFAQQEQTSDKFKKINPKARVPVLDIDGTYLTEAGSILEYIASQVSEKQFFPSSPLEAAQARQIMYYLASTMHINFAHKLRGYRWAKHQSSFDDMAAMVPETMNASCQYLEDEVFSDEGDYILGEIFSVVDCYLFAIYQWFGMVDVDINNYPKLARWAEAMENRESVKKARAEGFLG